MCHHPGYHRQGKEVVSGSLGLGRRELLVHVRDFCPIMLQVAFASDFDSKWNHMPLLLKHSGQRGWGHCLTTPLLECRRPFQSGRGGVDVVKVNIIHQICMWRCVLLARVCADRLLALTDINQ